MALAIGSGAFAWIGCGSEEPETATQGGRGGSAGVEAAGQGGAEDSEAAGSGGSAGSPNPRMCHLDCISVPYCEDGTVYRDSGSSPAFPCGTPLPRFTCFKNPVEECAHGCAENGLECAAAGGPGTAGMSGQGGEGGATNGGAGGEGGS